MPDLEAQLDAPHEGILAPPVCKALGRDPITIEDWVCFSLDHGVINPVTVGLYQIAGTARDRDEKLQWSVILKAIHWVDLARTPLAEGYLNEPCDWNYWKREALAFQSGIFDRWKGDLVPVRCYDVVEQTEPSVWLWLEHVREPQGTTFTLERHILAARHFGQFGGAFSRDGLTPDLIRPAARQAHTADRPSVLMAA